MQERKQLSKKTRFEVFKRDKFVCQYCGSCPPEVILHVDHITPVASGGLNDMDNLITACAPCNLGKHANNLSVIPQSLKDKAEEIAESELQIKGYQKIIAKKRNRLDNEAWKIAEMLIPGSSESGINRQWIQSIKIFLGKLCMGEVIDSMEIALTKRLSKKRIFLYFCGVCWRKIRAMEELENNNA